MGCGERACALETPRPESEYSLPIYWLRNLGYYPKSRKYQGLFKKCSGIFVCVSLLRKPTMFQL